MNEKVFLIGNGINRAVSNGVNSWENLLKKLSESFQVKIDFENEYKPFPLLFEEILFRTPGNFTNNLRVIKNTIAESFRETPANEIHHTIVKSGIKHILTTNYDYAFEKVLIPNFNNENYKIPKSTGETYNSIKRKIKIGELSIWHIHGEINQRNDKNPTNSIMIGYEHYGSYLSEIQKYINGIKGSKDKPITLKTNDASDIRQSWIDFFFLSELHILGLSFDFSEHHLWWILNYRFKQIKCNKINKNDIYYYYPEIPEIDPQDLTKYAKLLNKKKILKAKLDLFDSLGVIIKPIKCNDHLEFYRKVLD